jgi:hypothetical protein
MLLLARSFLFQLGCLPLDCVACLQSIQRLGGWNLATYQTSYLLASLKPECLLVLNFWLEGPGELNIFWRPNFMVKVPQELIDYLTEPWLSEFRQKVEAALAAHAQVPQAALGFVRLVSYLMHVVVQDSLELAEEFPDNPVHKLLLQNALFR